MNSKYIYQIYYDDATQLQLAPGFIPLDNTINLRPDWYEFWAILNFLNANELEEGAWYGFLSPKFCVKTGCSADFILQALDSYVDGQSVALFSSGWDQIAYFLNPFEQGEFWHPGITGLSQQFIDDFGLSVNLGDLVTDSMTSVFSNYIIAKKGYWLAWKKIAQAFFMYCENSPEFGGHTTAYGSIYRQAPMKVFIQERFASLILSTGSYKVACHDQSLSGPIFTRLFADQGNTRQLLQACDLMKINYRRMRDRDYLRMYWKTRREIPFSNLKF